ncbi:dihydrolipoamide acetyltransferase family protein [Clostridiaceae bacterium 35-E11]
MAKFITMPKLGLTMKEGKLTKWHKKEGDEVKAGEVLFDVETSKLTNEVEANENGFLRKYIVNEGDVVPCLQPVAIIGGKNEDISTLLAEMGSDGATSSEKQEKKETIQTSLGNKEKAEGKRVLASPVAKKLAKEKGIDISKVVGTGPNGRITVEDVEIYKVEEENTKATPMAKKAAEKLGVKLDDIHKEERVRKQDVYDFYRENQLASAVNPKEEKIPMTSMRKVIADRMQESWSISPVVHYNMRVDMTNLKALKNQLKTTVKLTYTDLLVKIVAKALMEFPLVNGSVEEDGFIYRNYVNMGVAVALEEGLIVPVIKYAHAKGLKEISQEVKELADKAKNNELTGDEITGGTFTITNLGMFGMEAFTPIINQPEVGILGVNTIVETPVVEKGEVVIKPLMNLSLTADHRAVDGAVAAQFLAKIKEYIENPGMLLL